MFILNWLNDVRILEDNESNQHLPSLETKELKRCSICNEVIPQGEYYVESILTGKITCSKCDEGILTNGDIFYSIE